MKNVILAILLGLSLSAQAEDKPRRDPVPGGARADHHFYKQWENMVKGQKFPQLPHASKLTMDGKKLPKIEARQRYIFQMDVRFVGDKDVIWDRGYYYFPYETKEQGKLWIVVHPKYRDCFDDLGKRFDLMQFVVWENGDLEGWKQVVVEYPRQCLGQLKTTGSKLKDAKGELE